MKKLIRNITLFFFCLSLSNIASAVKVSPSIVELKIQRGQNRNIVLTLVGSKGGENLKVYPTDLSINKIGVHTFEKMDNSKFSGVSWIKLNETKFALSEGQKKELKLKISVPMDAQPGEYYSIIMVEQANPTRMEIKDKEDKKMVMYLTPRNFAVIILNVPGRIYEKKGQATSAEMIPISEELIQEVKNETDSENYKDNHNLFYALPDIKQFAGKTLIVSSFRNISNRYLLVSGMAIIRSEDKRTNFGQVKLLAMGNPGNDLLTFPGDERNFIGVWDKKLPKGKYVVDVMFDYGNKVKKAISQTAFSINQEVYIDESKNRFLVVEKEINMQIPVGALRTKVVKVSNSDYRPINVSFVSNSSWIKVEPKSLAIEPGKSKDIKLIVSNDGRSSKKTTIIVKPDRGVVSEIKLLISEKNKITKKITEKGRLK